MSGLYLTRNLLLVQPENKKDAKIITIRQLVLRQYKMTKQKKANEKKVEFNQKLALSASVAITFPTAEFSRAVSSIVNV